MQKVFQYAMDPPTHVVMGVELRPLTLGHLWLLHKHTDIFNDNDPTIGSLVVACTICMVNHSDYERVKRKWWMPIFLMWWGRKCKKFDFHKEYIAFLDYIKTNCEQAEFRFDPKRARAMGSPWHFRMLSGLMSSFAMSVEDAMDVEVLTGTALLACVTESRDEVDLWSDQSEELWERAQAN